MTPLRFTLTPLSAFGTPLKGDTLFGQLCWAVAYRFGEARLTELLEGYTEGRPFAVVSDAFPAGFLPRPALPLHRYRAVPGADRKRIKRRRWIACDDVRRPLGDWLAHAVDDGEVARRLGLERGTLTARRVQPHNTIHRLTGTTGRGEFAPYGVVQTWYAPGVRLEVYVCFDADRIDGEEIAALLADIGETGYGRDAGIGLGKFAVAAPDDAPWPGHDDPDAWLTLAPCAPQGSAWEPESCWWQPFTRFGRHGGTAVQRGRPFKNPVLLADTGAVLTPRLFEPAASFTGRGLGGDGRLSNAIAATVHQGYAPVLPVRLEESP